METIFKITIFWLIAVMTPGPNSVVTVNTVLTKGKLNGFITVTGILTGTIIWTIAGFLGISLLFKIVPFMYSALKICGAIYLIYSGIMIIKNEHKDEMNIEKGCRGRFYFYKKGLLVSLSNPKTAIFIASLFAAIVPKNAAMADSLIFFITILSVSIIWYFSLANFFSISFIRTKYKLFKEKIEKLIGTIFVLFGIKILMDGE